MSTSHTFRLFISSTFSDFQEERTLLQTKVFPEIKEYAATKGYVFQPIDLRWGVSNEAQYDQKALELCIEEVQSSKTQPHPNFLIMAGDRYGWIPLPYAIEKKEFETILKNIKDDDKEFLLSWYNLDENQLPPSYIIKQREDKYKDYNIWVKDEDRLRDILQTAVNQTNLTSKEKEKYFVSATEHEVINGILKYKDLTPFQEKLKKNDPSYELRDEQNIYGYIRDIKTIQDDKYISKFKDTNPIDANNFKDKLKNSILKENLLEVEANLINLSTDEINGSLNYSYEAIENEEDSNFVKTMIEFLKRSIDNFAAKDDYSQEEIESYEQKRFKDDKLKLFIGREKPLNIIDDYINDNNTQALIIYGVSGLGKSALMAKAIENSINSYKDKKIIYRFVGSIYTLNDSISLLISILKELGIEENIRTIIDETGQEKPEDIKLFFARVSSHLQSIKEDTVIFIDAIDQLTNEDEFIWLPITLPQNLKIIITALEDKNYIDDSTYFKNLQTKTSNLYKLEPFTNSKKLIESILKRYNRTIQPHQLNYLQNIYKDINTPLHLIIAAQELRYWRSTTPTKDIDPKGQALAVSQKEIVSKYIDNLTNLYHHDKEFVQRVFSYIYLSDGLSEAEILEIISQDKKLIEKLTPSTYHTNTTNQLPIAIWARLHTQIKEFLKLEPKDGVDTMQFFHREFNDAISSQDDLQTIHKELILLLQILLKSYQNDDFESNRWGKLYINNILRERTNVIKEINQLYITVQNMGLDIDVGDNENLLDKTENTLIEHSKFIINTIKDKNTIKKYFLYIKSLINYNNILDSHGICELNYFIMKDLSVYNNYLDEYLQSMNDLAFIYKNMPDKLDDAIKLGEEAVKLSKNIYLKDKNQSIAESYSISLSNLCTSYERIHEDLDKINKFSRPHDMIERKNNLTKIVELRKEAFEVSNKYCEINTHITNASNLIISLKNLGEMEFSDERLKKLIEAENIIVNILQHINNHIDNISKYTLSIFYSNCGMIYKSLGQYNDAEDLYKKAIHLSIFLYKEDNKMYVMLYLTNLFNLMQLYEDFNNDSEVTKQAGIIKKISIENDLKNSMFYKEANKILTNTEGNNTNIIDLFQGLLQETNSIEYAEPFTTLLYIAKGLAIRYNNAEDIRINELYNALHSVELSEKAEGIFRKIFGENMDNLNQDTDGKELIELAKSYPKIKYDEDMKSLVKQLNKIFGEEKILNVRK